MYFRGTPDSIAREVASVVTEVAEDAYNIRKILSQGWTKEVIFEFRISLDYAEMLPEVDASDDDEVDHGADNIRKELFVHLRFNNDRITYNIDTEASYHRQFDYLYLAEDKDIDYEVAAYSGRRYIFQDLMEKAIESKVKALSEDLTLKSGYLWDLMPISLGDNPSIHSIFDDVAALAAAPNAAMEHHSSSDAEEMNTPH